MKIVGIIQARMGSSRLPGKVLADIVGKPMIRRIVERVSASRLIDDIIVATTVAEEDDVLEEYIQFNLNCRVFRGSVNDVLERYFLCARKYQADIIVRLTADDPLKDPLIIDKAIKFLLDNPTLDYCSNTIEPSYPEGLDVEVIRFSALECAYENAQLLSEREHVTPYIWKQPHKFSTQNFTFDKDLSDWRWTIDKPKDLEFMRCVYTKFNTSPLVLFTDVISWLEQNPDIQKINTGTARNEGYLKSLNMER
jgi:spore coat polysaccharide biosynthesis protein SpsF